jgi:hypothetical protein
MKMFETTTTTMAKKAKIFFFKVRPQPKRKYFSATLIKS